MSGKYSFAGMILLLALLLPVLVPVAGAQGSGSLTRGSTFTVTVIGIPRTKYDIWPKGTSSMTGEPGDQPPIIVPGQVDVVRDPPDGPYLIGSHMINGGGTILGDVPPTSSGVSNTSFYAEVRTDASGHGVVLFQTSQATALQQFHIVAQNPADPNEDVQVVLGIPTRVPTPMMPLPLPTTMETPLIPVTTTTAAPVPPVQPTLTPAPVTLQTTTPTQIPVQGSPMAQIPLPDIIGIAAVGIGVLVLGMGKKR